MARPTRRTVLAPKRRIAAALRGAASSPDAPSAPVPLRLVRRSRAALLRATALQGCAALVLALPAVAQPAPNARPTGGQVVAGSASIHQGGPQTTVTQSSQRAAVEWKSFDVGSQHTVRFQQPSASAVTLNRVTGPDPSHIAGRIQANGQVVLTNQSGVTFARGAQVDTAGLIVSAAGISNRNFMAGKMVFDQPAKRDAAIVNEGTITVRQAGLAALVAPHVANTGTITAQLGHVVLAGARAATLDLYGDGLVSLDVTRQVTETPRGPDGKPVTALVTNDGVVRAEGGTVQLSARAVDGVVTNLVTAGGTISAPTRAGRAGTIAIGGLGGNVTVTGTLAADGRRADAPRTARAGATRGARGGDGTDARGRDGTDARGRDVADARGRHVADARGGAVEVTASGTVTLAAGARISASGPAGGGAVAIGTALARARGLTPTGAHAPSTEATTRAAAATIVEPGARIAADAGTNGAGGRVAILSAGRTRMDGAITARGGAQGGDGGLVEVSGHALGLTGSIDTGAQVGRAGSILLDPDLLLVVDGSSGSGAFDTSFLAQSGTIFAAQPDSGYDTISNAVINGFTGNVLLQANQVLAVLADIDLTRGAHQSLTLESGGLLSIGPGVKVTASGDVVLASGGVGPGTPPPAWLGNAITVFGTIASTGGSVSLLTGAQGTIAVDAEARISAAQGQRLTLQGDMMTLAGRLAAPGGIVEIAPSSALPIDLGGTTGLGLAPATLAAIDTRVLRLGAVTVDGTLATTATAIRIDAPLTLAGTEPEITPSLSAATESRPLGAGTLDLQTPGSVVVAADGGISVGLLTGAIGALDAGQGSNRIAGIGSLTVTGLLSLANAGGIILSGPITTGGALTISDTGAIILTGSVSAGDGASLRSGSAIAIDGHLSADGDLELEAADTLTVAGTVTAGPTLTATAGSGGIALDAGALLQAGTVDLSGGSVRQDAAAAIVAQHLRSSGGVAGDADLGGANAIGTLDGFAAGGGFVLSDAALAGTLVLAGPLSASGILVEGGANPVRVTGTARAEDRLDLRGATLVMASGGELAGPALTLAAGAGGLTLAPGALLGQDGATLALGTAGGVREAAGATIRAGLLLAAEGGLTGDVVLRGTANAIARLGTLPVEGMFLLRNTGPLTVAGALSAAGVDLDTTGSLAVAGSILPTAGAIDIALAGATIDLPGLVRDNGGSVALTARAGNVWEVGTLDAGLLTGSAAGRVAFLGENRIATLGSFAAAEDFRLFTTGTVTVAGAVEVGVGQTLGLRSDGLVVAGTLTAPDGVIAIAPLSAGGTIGIDDQRQPSRLSLTQAEFDGLHAGTVTLGALGGTIAGAIQVDGSASLAPANAPVLRLAATGPVSGAGSLGAATLTGSAGSVALTGANRIVTLGSFTADGAFGLANAGDLTIAGPVTAGSTLAITGSGAVSQVGSLAAPDITLTAASLTLLAPITAPNGVTLRATEGAIEAAAPIATAALGGAATGRATLGGANRIATLADFAAAQGLTLTDTVDLTVTGRVTGGPSVLLSQTGTLTLAGTIAAGDVALAADGLQLGGTILAPGALQLVASNAIVQTGRLAAGSVTAAAGGAVQLVGSDTIAILGNVTAPGGLTLRNQGDLVAAGQVLAGPAADIAATGGLTVAGALSATTVALQGSSVTIQGAVAAPGAIGVTATAGDVLVNGTLMNAPLVNAPVVNAPLAAGPGAAGRGTGTVVAEASGSLRITGTISGGGIALASGADILSSGSIAGERVAMQAGGGLLLGGGIGADRLDLRAGAGALLQGGIDAGAATLQAGGGAALTGRVSAGALAITVGGDLGLGGTIAAGTLTATAGGAIAIPGGIAAGAATLSAGGSLSLTGALAADAVELAAGGDLIAPGSLAAGTLDGRAGGAVTLTGENRIATIGSLVAGGALTLRDGQGVTVTGLLQAGTGLDLAAQGALVLAGTARAETGVVAAPAIAVPGTLAVAQGVSLTATEGDLGGTGRVQAAVLTGQAAGAIALTGPNEVQEIAGLRAGSGITMTNQPSLTIAGPVDGGQGSVGIGNQASITIAAPVTAAQRIAIQSAAGGLVLRDTTIDAPQILLSTPASQSVLLSGGTIATGGTTPRGRVPANSPLLPSNGGQGALVATGTLRQTGTLTVQGPSGGDPVLQLQAAGNVSLARVEGVDTWLVLSLRAGRATATDLAIARLDVMFDGVGGSANLVGSVGGITGAASAQQAYILPRSDPNYLLNGCAIGSVSCILVQREQVPAQRPLDTVDFAPLRQPGDDADLMQLLPNVSRRDY